MGSGEGRRRTRAAHLTWRPHEAEAWERETAECSLAGRGALVTLADALWRSEHGPCAVPDDDATLALWCRARREWGSVALDVRMVLAPHPTMPGMLTWPWLLALYTAQRARYERRASAGARGGKAAAKGSIAARAQEVPHNSIADPEAALLPAVAANGSIARGDREREKDSLPLSTGERESFSLALALEQPPPVLRAAPGASALARLNRAPPPPALAPERTEPPVPTGDGAAARIARLSLPAPPLPWAPPPEVASVPEPRRRPVPRDAPLVRGPVESVGAILGASWSHLVPREGAS